MAQLDTSLPQSVRPAGDGPVGPMPRAAPTPVGATAKTVLVTALVALTLCFGIGFYSSSSRPDTDDRILLAVALIAPAVGFAVTRSTLLLDHFLLVVVVNRLLRRLMDWGEGRYDALPLLSLLPLAMAFLMGFAIQRNWHRVPTVMRQAALFLAAAMGYGLLIGVPSYGLPAAYACAEYATPLLVLYYCVSNRPSTAVLRRWLTVLATLGVLCGGYGIYQWFYVPPWDAAWLMWSGMYSSMGGATAFRMSIMGTLESRGPASLFFAVLTTLFVALPFLRRRGGVLLGVVPAVALLLTTARTGVVYAVLTLLASSVLARGPGGLKILLALGVIATGAVVVLARQQESALIFDRVATLGDLQSDGSTNVRVQIAQRGVSTVLANPLGFGFGSGGNATRAGKNEQDQDAVGDNGYLEILSMLGIPGAVLYFTGLLQIVLLAFRGRSLATGREPTTHLGLGLALSLAPALVIGNCLTTAHASYVWIILSRHLAAAHATAGVRRRATPPGTAVPA